MVLIITPDYVARRERKRRKRKVNNYFNSLKLKAEKYGISISEVKE